MEREKTVSKVMVLGELVDLCLHEFISRMLLYSYYFCSNMVQMPFCSSAMYPGERCRGCSLGGTYLSLECELFFTGLHSLINEWTLDCSLTVYHCEYLH